MKKYFRDHFFFFILFLGIFFVVIFSYYRFMIKYDYVVGYHGSCDPSTGKCFKNCEDDACTKVDYYTEMQKYEPDLYKECGQDITNCDVANICLSNDRECLITYCNKSNSDKDNPCQTLLDTQINTQTNPISNSSNTNI